MSKQIWVICDEQKNACETYELSLISKAVSLKDTDDSVVAIHIGIGTKEQISELFYYGIDKAIVLNVKNEINKEMYTEVLYKMFIQYKPELVFFSDTPLAKHVSAILSTRLEIGLTADCIDIIKNDEGKYTFIRTALSNSVYAYIQCINPIMQMGTLKSNIFPVIRMERQNSVNVEEYKFDMTKISNNNRIKLLEEKEIIKEESNEIDISRLRLVIAIGRGIMNCKNVERIKNIAEKIGAEVVGTRAAVEEKFIEKSRQIGQSGISISPDIYIAFGISGASQHIIGMKNSKRVIAINIDQDAPIFKYADYAIVSDVSDILNKLEQELA